MFFLLSFFLLILINRMFNFEKGSPFFIVAAVLTSIFIMPIYDLPTHLADMFWLDSISFPIMFMTIMLSAMFSMAYISTPYVVMLILLSILTFTTSNLINFYIFFELNLIPIFIIILGWGYQPERFFATKMMMMYTLVGSLPLFISIICYPWAMNMTVMFLQSSSFSNVFFILLFTNAFLVKLPIFSVHLWLPLAHVEAPLVGSMILAGVLLKLGGYGMIRMALAFMNPVSIFNISMTGFCLIGALIAMIYCSTQVDLKVIIAYSSVAHMSMAAVAVLTLSSSGISAAMINLVVHGFTSSLMFFSAGSMYLFSNSRHILINKGLINITPFFLVPWFSACLMNAGGPPSMNLLSEIMFSFSIINLDSILMFPLAFIIILGMYFNMKIYSITTQGSYPPFFTSKMPMSDSWVMSSLLHVNISLLCLLAIFIMVV